MLHASSRGGRPGAFSALLLTAVLLGGLLVVTPPGAAQDAREDARPAEKGTNGKAAEATAPAPAAPYRVHDKAAKDVAEMVQVINTKLAQGWKENNVTPSKYVDDYEFIRRASLDIIGRIATRDEIDRFLRDPAQTRRSLLIDRLLGAEDDSIKEDFRKYAPQFAEHWADLWTNWLLSRTGVFGRGTYRDQMEEWLKKQFATNRPYDALVRDLITAEGSNRENGAVNFILAHVGETVPADKRRDEGQFEMVPLTSRITRLFLGTQVQCCQCHDHPFQAALKQNHFWGVNAFLRQVVREGTPPMERAQQMMTYPALTLRDEKSVNVDATVFYEKRNGVILQTKAQFLPAGEEKRGGRLPADVNDPSQPANARRRELANFLIAHDNFPRAIVNRMWGVFFGRGFVNPVDDFNDQNQPQGASAELLDELAGRFKHYGYDLKKLIRWICNSNAYSLSYVANKTNDKQEVEVLFSRMLLKSMSPEQLFESLAVATDPGYFKPNLRNDKERRDQRNRWLNNLVANFGDDEGNEVNFNGTVVQALMMMNGQDLNDAVTRPGGTVALAMARNRTPQAIITELYLTALNRRPTAQEMKGISERLALRPQFAALDLKNPAGRYQDLFWALLNSNEFLLNH